MKKCKKCGVGLSNRVSIHGRVHNISSRKFCLECSPFGAHNTRNLVKVPLKLVKQKKCTACNVIKHRSAFYQRKGSRANELHSSCIECVKSKSKNMKLRAVKYKGGKCASCGYNKTLSALEFHHKDPKQKDFAISRRMNGATEATFELLKKELDKCNLLCSNCHREAHERERNGKNRRLNHN